MKKFSWFKQLMILYCFISESIDPTESKMIFQELSENVRYFIEQDDETKITSMTELFNANWYFSNKVNKLLVFKILITLSLIAKESYSPISKSKFDPNSNNPNHKLLIMINNALLSLIKNYPIKAGTLIAQHFSINQEKYYTEKSLTLEKLNNDLYWFQKKLRMNKQEDLSSTMTKRKVEDISETSGNNGVLNEHESNKRFHQESIGESERFKIRVKLQNKNSTLDYNKITNGVVNKDQNSKYMFESKDERRKRMIQEALFESECAKSMVKILPKYVENSNDSLNNEAKFVAKLCATLANLTEFVNNEYNQNEESISISHQYIPMFSLAPFEIFIKLKALYIMNTNTKTFINPINLPNLEMLKFASNQIETLHTNTFSNLTNLQAINFSKNKITQLNSNIFKGLKKLKRVIFFSNQIKSLDSGLFRDALELEEVNFCKNELIDIDSDVFAGLKNLRELDLSKNQLTELNQHVFKGLINLRNLKLSFNHLIELHPNQFDDLVNMDRLDCSFNHLNVLLDSHLFSNLSNLKFLILKHNEIEEIAYDLFKSTRLLEIDLSYNRINMKSIDISRFKSLKQELTIFFNNNV